MAAVSIVVSILAAMSFPSMGRMQAKNELRSAMAEVEGAFREAQRNAIKRGSTCTVNVRAGVGSDGTVAASNTAPSASSCIPLAISMPRNVTIDSPTNATTTTTSVSFSFKGNPSSTRITAGNDDVIRLSSSVTSTDPRCLVIAPGIGLMRSGYYRNNDCVTDL